MVTSIVEMSGAIIFH